jgi:hypothetical protein
MTSHMVYFFVIALSDTAAFLSGSSISVTFSTTLLLLRRGVVLSVFLLIVTRHYRYSLLHQSAEQGYEAAQERR